MFKLEDAVYSYKNHCLVLTDENFTLAFKTLPKTDRKKVSAFAMSMTIGNDTQVIWEGVDTDTDAMLLKASDTVEKIRQTSEYKKAYQI